MKVGVHRFESDPSLPQRDGVNLAHTEINRFFDAGGFDGIHTEYHEFDRLLSDGDYARRVLGGLDCVLSNVGPHAHFYHYLRHKLGLTFRIVRDTKTALWSSYLLQESLCAPYLRAGDALLATSNYSRVLTRRLFPHLRDHPIGLFEPVLADAAPLRGPVQHRSFANDQVVNLGYLGRLSEDKNFPQVVDLLLKLNEARPGGYRLIACGDVHSPSCNPDRIRQRLAEETGSADLFVYHPPVSHEDALDLIRQFDCFLFFSTSNLEVLGRVLIETTYAGIPTLAARHAAAAELLSPAALLEVSYREGVPFDAHTDAPLGSVDIEQAATLILEGRVPLSPGSRNVNRSATLEKAFRDALPTVDMAQEYAQLDPAQQVFIDNLEAEGLTRYASVSLANRTIEDMLEWFCALNGRRSDTFSAYSRRLLGISRFRERTQRFLEKSKRTRGDFSSIGGIDIELCHIAGFYPRFTLHPAAPGLSGQASEILRRA
jgi:glycosyltransferase involved in cell wall biosynthesis